jgi:quercetin dioxygenase-like cupin family protein
MSYRIEFDKMLWDESVEGARIKSFISGNQQVRIVKFSEDFVEQDWCQKGHVGYVIDGKFSIDYNGTLELYKKGDIIFIPEGEQSKHKTILDKGEKVTLLLFEIID